MHIKTMKTISAIAALAFLFGFIVESRGQYYSGSKDLLGPPGNSKDLFGPPPPSQQDSPECQDAKKYLAGHGITPPKDCALAIKLASDLAAQEYANQMTLQAAQSSGGTQPIENNSAPIAQDEKKRPRKKNVRSNPPIVQNQTLPPPPPTKEIDRLLGGLSQRDARNGTGAFEDSRNTTPTDEDIPMPSKQQSGNANSSQSDVPDELGAARDDGKGDNALIQVFGDSQPKGKEASQDGMDSLKQAFGDLPPKASSGELTRLQTPSPNSDLQPIASYDPGIWQSKDDVLKAVTDNSARSYSSVSGQPADQESSSALASEHSPQYQTMAGRLLGTQTTSETAASAPSIVCANLGIGGTLGFATKENYLPGYTGGDSASLCLDRQSGNLYFVNTFSKPDPNGFALGAELHPELGLSFLNNLPVQETSKNSSATFGPMGFGFNADGTRVDLWVASLTVDNSGKYSTGGVKVDLGGNWKPKAGFALSDSIDSTTVTPLGNIFWYQNDDAIASHVIGFPTLSPSK